ncbi:hypothetical protein ACQY0O_004553 [Thecaphora frezii]
MPDSYNVGDTTSTTSQSISDIVIDTSSSSADSLSVPHRTGVAFLPVVPPRTSSHASPMQPPARVASHLLDPFTTPDGAAAPAPSSYLQRAPMPPPPPTPVERAGFSRYVIATSSPFAATPVEQGGAPATSRHAHSISPITTPSAPVSFPVLTVATTAVGRTTRPPDAPRRPLPHARDQFASTPESSFPGPSTDASLFGRGHPVRSLDDAAHAQERRARNVDADPFLVPRHHRRAQRIVHQRGERLPGAHQQVDGDEDEDDNEDRGEGYYNHPPTRYAHSHRSVGLHPPVRSSAGATASAAFQTPTNPGLTTTERGLTFEQIHPSMVDTSFSIDTSSHVTRSQTEDGILDRDAPTVHDDDDKEAASSSPKLMLRTWKGETVGVPSYLVQPDMEALSRSATATQGVLETFLGLRVLHGWYGHEYHNPISDPTAVAARDAGAGSAKPNVKANDGATETETETITLYDAFGRVRSTVRLPPYAHRGGPNHALPPPRESHALRQKAQLRLVQRRNARLVAATTGSGKRNKNAATAATKHAVMRGLRNAVLDAQCDDWTLPIPAPAVGSIYTCNSHAETQEPSGEAEGQLFVQFSPKSFPRSVWSLEHAHPGDLL